MEVRWMPESKAFSTDQLHSPSPITLFSSDGKTRYDTPVPFSAYGAAISQKGYQAWYVVENNEERIKVKLSGGNWETIFLNRPVAGLIWDPVSGDTLLIIGDDGIVYAAGYPYHTSHETGRVGQYLQIIWVP
jgi:hypothetical protein